MEDIDILAQLSDTDSPARFHGFTANILDGLSKCVNISKNGGVEVQRRGPYGNVDNYFKKEFNDYKEGFKNNGEMWLGLRNIRSLVQDGYTEMEMRFGDWDGTQYIRYYNDFYLDDAPRYSWRFRDGDFLDDVTERPSINLQKSNLCPLSNQNNQTESESSKCIYQLYKI